jgi:glycine dehydrogenase subunit 2
MRSAFCSSLRTVTETLDALIDAMIEIADLANNDPEKLKAAPVTTPVSRPDEVAAAKNLNIAFRCFD